MSTSTSDAAAAPVGRGPSVDDPPGVDPARDEDRLEGLVVRVALVLFVVLRAGVVAVADAPAVTPDEPGSWAIAKWLSMTPGTIEMLDMPSYPLVSGAVLAPLWWLPVDSVTRYRLGLVVAAALTVLAATVMRRAVAMMTGDPRLASIGFATVLLSASTAFAGSFTYAEPTVLLCWCVLVWGVVSLHRDGPRTAVLVTSAVAAAAPVTHGRLVAIPVVWALALVGVAWHDRTAPRGARRRVAPALVLTVVGSGFALVVQRAARTALWSDAEPAVKGSVTSWLADPDYWVTLVVTAAGQLWYLVVASAGLAVAGGVLLGRMAWRPSARWERPVALTLGAMLAGNLVVSATVMAGFLHETDYRPDGALIVPRWDHLVYGRYNDAAVVVLSVLGLVWAWRRRDRRSVAAVWGVAVALLLSAAWLVRRRLEQLEIGGSFPTPNISALGVLLPARGGIDLWRFTWCALVLVVVVGVAAALGRRVLGVAVAALLVVSTAVGTHDAAGVQGYRVTIDLADQLGPAPTSGRIVAVASDANLDPVVRTGIHPAQFELVASGWQTEFDTAASDALAADPGTAEVVLLVDGVAPATAGWRRVGTYGQVAAWRRPD